MSSRHETSQSPPPSSAPTQLQPAVTAGVLPNHRIAQPPSPLTSTQPLPVAATEVTSNHGSAQSPPPYQEPPPTPIPPDRATPSPVPLLTKTRPASDQHHQTPPNVAQELQSQARTFTKTTLNISLEVGVASQLNSPNVAITTHAQAEFTSSQKSHDRSSRNVPGLAGPLDHQLEGLANKASKPNATPPPSQTQTNWGLGWFQSYWKGGK
jgi:hypothetical protein